jgi:hypothetical protein
VEEMSREFSLKQSRRSRAVGGERGVVLNIILISLIGLLISQTPAMAQTRDIDLGVSVSDGRLQSFYLAIGEHYGVQPRYVVDIRERYRCPDDELPVVFFLATRAHVESSAIISLRLKKMSWLDIAFHFRLTPDIFFIPLAPERIGPPYGKAYGYYRKYGPAGDWKKMVLTDREVVDLVNLRFMSEHHRMTPEAVMAMRGRESKFVVINDEIRKEKEKGKSGKQDQNQKGKGNAKKKH